MTTPGTKNRSRSSSTDLEAAQRLVTWVSVQTKSQMEEESRTGVSRAVVRFVGEAGVTLGMGMPLGRAREPGKAPRLDLRGSCKMGSSMEFLQQLEECWQAFDGDGKGISRNRSWAPSPGLADPRTGPAMHALQHTGPHWLHGGVHGVGHHEQSGQ